MQNAESGLRFGMPSLGVLLVLLVAGCGDGRVAVRGTVTYDGVPVEQGAISFVPRDGVQGSDGGEIVDGQFSVNVRPGSKKVEIRASRPLQNPRPNDPDAANLREDFVPARYNTQTELTAEITGGEELKFELVSGGEG